MNHNDEQLAIGFWFVIIAFLCLPVLFVVGLVLS